MEIRHIAEQEARIASQEALIERLRNVGAPTAEAFVFLGSMTELLESMRAHLARLSKHEGYSIDR
jgi:hypothetical protein